VAAGRGSGLRAVNRIVSASVPATAGLEPYEFVLQPAWCDYNEHFSDGYYLVAFSMAAERALDALGLGARYRAQGHFSVYTVESQVRYLREAKAGDALLIRQWLLKHDLKRLWLQQEMLRGHTLVASCTFVYLHVDTSIPRAAPFPTAILHRMAEHCRTDAGGAIAAGRPTPPGGLR